MNTLARGKRLSSMITGTLGLLGIIAATALGLHTWADIETTKMTDVAASTSTASTYASSTDDTTTDDTATDSGASR